LHYYTAVVEECDLKNSSYFVLLFRITADLLHVRKERKEGLQKVLRTELRIVYLIQ